MYIVHCTHINSFHHYSLTISICNNSLELHAIKNAKESFIVNKQKNMYERDFNEMQQVQ